MIVCDKCGEKVTISKFTCFFEEYRFRCSNCGKVVDFHDFDELLLKLQQFRVISSCFVTVISGLVWRTLYKYYHNNLFIFAVIFIYIAISFTSGFILSPFYYKMIKKYFR